MALVGNKAATAAQHTITEYQKPLNSLSPKQVHSKALLVRKVQATPLTQLLTTT
jgi:hypothetical protein